MGLGSSDRRLLAVHAQGNNSRLGNMLILYIRLLRFAEDLGRVLSFPFAERSIGRLFHLDPPATDLDQDVTQALYARLLQTADEAVGPGRDTATGERPDGKVHKIGLGLLNCHAIFARGSVDWAAFADAGGFACDGAIVLRDPFPFDLTGETIDETLAAGKGILRPRADVFALGMTQRQEHVPPDHLDLCLHIRQSDFRQWNQGRFWYDAEQIAWLIEALQTVAALRPVSITILSDAALPDTLHLPASVRFQHTTVEGDFARLAAADIVLSYNSTFAKIASLIGRHIFDRVTMNRVLGPSANLPERFRDICPDLIAFREQCKESPT